MKTQRSADITTGFILIGVGLLAGYASTMITGGMEERLPPRTLPYTISFLIFFCGIGLAVKSWRFRGEDIRIKWPDGQGIRIILVVLTSLALYIGLMGLLGLPLSTTLYIAFSIWYLKRSKWFVALLIGLLTGLTSYYLFIRLLELSFPVGFFME